LARQIDYRSELVRLSASFEAAIGDLRVTTSPGFIDRGMRPGNIAVLLPHFLVEGTPFDGDLDAARTLALGNAFATSHFLVLDRQMDGDEEVLPESSWLSDRCLALSVREYARLFPSESAFWQHHGRYLDEYFASLRWERDVLWSDSGAHAVLGEALPAALRRLGLKLSPVKAAAAGVAMLSGHPERLDIMERVVEDFHTAYQLSDDLDDLSQDLANGRRSLAAWIIARRGGLEKPPQATGVEGLLALAVESGALPEIAHEISRRYDLAAAAAREIGAHTLSSHLERMRDSSERFHSWLARRVGLVAAATRATESGGDGGECPAGAPRRGRPRVGAAAWELHPGVHAFTVQGKDLVFDPGSGLLFETDRIVADVLSWMARGRAPADLDVLRADYGAESLRSALSDVEVLASGRPGAQAAPSPLPWFTNVVCLALDVTDGCNLACDYCYLGRPDIPRSHFMSDETAFQAVDLLLRESLGERRLSIVFFGGEPLMRPDLMERVVRYARARAGASGRRVSFHTTTNGTLLTPEAADELRALGIQFLVSMDGDRSVHDRHRVFPGAVGSYDVVASNLRRMPASVRLHARATVTPESAPLPSLVSHLSELGFATVHLAPVSGPAMSVEFAGRLEKEFEDLASAEVKALRAGRAPRVGNFVEGILALESGPGRLAPCGAGTRYLCVGPGGGLFLCHRFAGDSAHAVGDVAGGVDRDAVTALLVRARTQAGGCGDCWARPLCGGPCFYDLSVAPDDCAGPDAPRCRVRKRVLELSMWLYASLDDHVKERLAQAARERSRPELDSRIGGRA
jgi:uncharacterized protein